MIKKLKLSETLIRDNVPDRDLALPDAEEIVQLMARTGGDVLVTYDGTTTQVVLSPNSRPRVSSLGWAKRNPNADDPDFVRGFRLAFIRAWRNMYNGEYFTT